VFNKKETAVPTMTDRANAITRCAADPQICFAFVLFRWTWHSATLINERRYILRDLKTNTLVTENNALFSPPPAFNPDDYRDELKDLDLTDEQAQELLSVLWNIMAAMVDMGWGLDATQLVLGQIFCDQSFSDKQDEDSPLEADNEKEVRT
jgi:hypothetical protein